MTVMKCMFWIVPLLEFEGRANGQQTVQIQVQPQVVGRSIRDGQVTTVFLAPRYVTSIRMAAPFSSIIPAPYLLVASPGLQGEFRRPSERRSKTVIWPALP